MVDCFSIVTALLLQLLLLLLAFHSFNSIYLFVILCALFGSGEIVNFLFFINVLYCFCFFNELMFGYEEVLRLVGIV